MLAKENKLRLFVAIDLPEAHKAAIGEAQRGFPDLAWSPSRQLHLTLRFIGAANAVLTAGITAGLREAAVSPFVLQPAGAGFFPGAASAAVFWFGFQASPVLLELKREVDAVLLTAAGLTPGPRAFVPHLTMLRFKYRPSRELAERLRTTFAALSLPAFSVHEFSLCSSLLTSSGAVHRKIATYQLLSGKG